MSGRQALRAQVAALAPWFHNIDLGDGLVTAPDHFLGDYPRFKFARFADALPADLTGKSVLDIGCNAGFYSVEMKRRGAGRVVGIDSDERYLAQARLASEALGFSGIEFRNLSVYDVAALGERFDLVIFMGVLYHLRHPLLALDLIREHVAGDRLLFQTMQRGSNDVIDVPEDHPFHMPDTFAPSPIFDDPGLSEDALHRAALRRGLDQLVGAEPRRFRGDAARRRLHDRELAGGGSLSLPRCAGALWGLGRGHGGVSGEGAGNGGRRVIEAAMIWNEPNNKSHWDPGARSRMGNLCRHCDPSG